MIGEVGKMKIRKDKDILLFTKLGSFSILFGCGVLFFQIGSKTVMVLGGMSILVGIMMCIMALVASTKPKTELIRDERITRINEKAGYNAGWLIMLAVTILFWVDKIWSLNIELKDMYYTTIFVGAYSWLILRWYYNKRCIE